MSSAPCVVEKGSKKSPTARDGSPASVDRRAPTATMAEPKTKPTMSLAAARAVLKVERSSSGEDVKKAYKKLALKHHPDKGGSADEFRKVNEAMEMCMDHLYEPASFSRSGLAAPDRRPGAGETSWADVKVYWTPGARGFGPMPMPYGPPPPLTRLPLAYFRDLLAGRVREAALAETADLDYLIVDARSEDERTATGEATLSSLGDIRLRVAIATLPPEACLDGSGDVVLPWVHTLADWANRKEARRLSETAKAALRAAESANDRGALVVVVSQTGSAIKHDRGDDEVAAEFLRNAQVLLAPAREGVDRTPASAPPPHSSSDSDEPAPPAPKQRSTSRWAIHKPEGWVPKSQRTPEAASPPPRKQKHPISPQATTPVPPRSFAAFMKSRKPGETPTTPKSRAVR